MKTETKEIYKCDHCNKLYQVKRFAIQHELICNKNPENSRPCLSCPMLEKKQTTVCFDAQYGGEDERKINVLYCSRKKIFLHLPKNQIKNNAFNLGDETNHPMPKECKEYNDSLNLIDYFLK